MEEFFGQNILNKSQLLKKAYKHLKTMSDQYKRHLKLNPKYEQPPMVPRLEWNEIIEDAKEKRLRDKGIKPPPRKNRYVVVLI